MNCRSGILLLSLSGSLWALVPSVNGAQPDPTAADKETLGAVKISVDGPSLLEFFRKRTPTPANRERIQVLIRQLGDNSFQAREQASGELAARGIAALPFLRQALKESDLEIVRRAEGCLQVIEKSEGGIPATTTLTNAAARLLAARKPAGAAEVLLDFIAAMDDADTAGSPRRPDRRGSAGGQAGPGPRQGVD
jgi:hypothetical protein